MKTYHRFLAFAITLLFIGAWLPDAHALRPVPKFPKKIKVSPTQLKTNIVRTYHFSHPGYNWNIDLPIQIQPEELTSSVNPPRLTSTSKASLKKKIQKIILAYPSSRDALRNVQKFQYALPKASHEPMYIFLTMYYSNYFGVQTPHVRAFLERVSLIWNKKLELFVTSRMEFLKDVSDEIIARMHLGPISKDAIRLRYMKDIRKLTADNFDSTDLQLSIEQRMSGNPKAEVPINGISNTTQVQVGGHMYPLYNYNGPLEGLHEMYRFLVVGNSPKAPLLVAFDEGHQSLAIYNAKKTRWLRITPHEFQKVNNLHIHLNDQRTVALSLARNAQLEEHANINLSIPFAEPEELQHLPEGVMPQDYLYQKLIKEPVEILQKTPNVIILPTTIF